MRRRAPFALALLLALAACGSQKELARPAGQAAPPAAYGRSEPRTASELLELDPQAAPERSVELRQQSEERADDPFDLPPAGAPKKPAENP
ncbi:MAG: hypothetical protein ABIT16_07345 [Croceibacterium sp.]